MIYDVVIAGAGPVGSFLACELRLAGVSVLVLERMEDPHSPLKAGWMGMRGLNRPSVEAFYRRGLLEDIRANALGWMNVGQTPGMALRGTAVTNSAPAPRFGAHFAGMMLDVTSVDFSNRKYAVGGPLCIGRHGQSRSHRVPPCRARNEVRRRPAAWHCCHELH